MAGSLNIRKLVTEEFQKEWIRLNGKKLHPSKLATTRDNFNLRAVHEGVNALIEAEEDNQAIRNYHKLNLRYLAKYFALTLSNQVKANSDHSFKDILSQAIKVLHGNPQYNIYSAYCK